MIKEFVIPKINPESAIIRVQDFVEHLPHTHPWLVSIKQYKLSRTQEQHRTYWMWLRQIGEILGYTAEELHEVCRWEYLPHVIVLFGKKSHEIPLSTTTLSIDEMCEYMEHIQRLAAEHHVQLTQPEGA